MKKTFPVGSFWSCDFFFAHLKKQIGIFLNHLKFDFLIIAKNGIFTTDGKYSIMNEFHVAMLSGKVWHSQVAKEPLLTWEPPCGGMCVPN